MDHGQAGGVEIPLALAEIAAGWPLAASLAAATAGGLHAGRRRTALNEALHELRRPLQALVLSVPAGRPARPGAERSLQMATEALERLEREINGKPVTPAIGAVAVRPLLEGVVARWRGPAVSVGGSLQLDLRAANPVVWGDHHVLAQALDNLVVNALEHGGPTVSVGVSRAGDRLRIVVEDSGRTAGAAPRRSPADLIARVSGRRRRGHGLKLVRRAAAAHGGDFVLRRSGAGTAAVLELPLCGAAEAA